MPENGPIFFLISPSQSISTYPGDGDAETTLQ